MLERLSRSLYEAISDSDDVHVHLKQLRDEGYTLNLLLDCQPDIETKDEHPDLEPRTRRALHSSHSPAFKIDSKDLSILRSLGIDPTRPQAPGTNEERKPSNGNYANGAVPRHLPPRPSIRHEAPLPPVGGVEERPRDDELPS